MTEREKFELWAESQGLYYSDEWNWRICEFAYEAWQAAKQQAHCEALADLHHLERKIAHGCTDASTQCDDPQASV